MSTTIQVDNKKPLTYKSALDKDTNIISKAAHFKASTELYQSLWDQRQTIEALVKHHLRLSNQDRCLVSAKDQWIHGSFNICIPIEVQSTCCYKLIFRCPEPHKLAELQYPGTVDEKMSSEVGAYAWIQQQCPDIRIPYLYGFGFTDHHHFVHEEQRPFYIRLWRRVQRNLFRHHTLSPYSAHPTRQKLSVAYMILEYIRPDTGQMLSSTLEKYRKDPLHRQNLFRGMARLMLSLASIPQPRIGSFQFHANGSVTLTNRPLSCSIVFMENEGARRTIQRNETYTCTEPFVADMLALHEHNFLSNPNAVYSAEDCRGQMAAGALLRMLSHHYIMRERRNGPFYLQFTDLHASNLLVDEQWNITCIIDLEWICALPAEMFAVPYWITGCGIDQIVGDNLDEFNKVRQEFVNIFEAEEVNLAANQKSTLGNIIRKGWESDGTFSLSVGVKVPLRLLSRKLPTMKDMKKD
ncbi:hypothetical protein BUE80_DR005423 [Diplocarpon rosae]|nr:hypothetical protein BUE80_DR005423 [Diplocarpon rosae]